MTPTEAVTASFYAWEVRGRGWELADYPVSLEPPYRPFFLLPGLLNMSSAIDDGKRPTLLSSLVEGAKGLLAPRNEPNEEPGPFEEQPPFPASPRGPLTTFAVRLPEGFETNMEAAERLLRAFSAALEPVSFELIGHRKAVSLQIVCSTDDREQIYGSVTGYAPGLTIIEEEDRLGDAWQQDCPNIVIDFGLAQEFFLPLESPRTFRVDLYISLVSALAQAKDDEVVCFQVIVEPVRNPWARGILRALLDEEGTSIFLDAPEFVPLAKEKVAAPLSAVIVRVASQARDISRAWSLARGTGSFFRQLARTGGNELVPLENDGYPDQLHEAAFLARQSFRTGMILSADELRGLLHIPDASVSNEALTRAHQQTKALPLEAKGHSLILGENVHRGRCEVATLSTAQRLQHTHIIGGSGTGKSTLLLNLITQDISNGEGVAVLDPHGDLIDEILARIPDERVHDVVVFDPGDTEWPVGFNILAASSEIEKNLLASDMVGIFQRFATSWGDTMSTVLGNAVLAILESPRGGTLLDLRRFLVENAFRKEYLRSVTDDEVRFFWEREYALIGARSLGPILTRLNTFLRPKLIRHIVAQKMPRVDLSRVMGRGMIFLAKLSQGIMGAENAYLLGSLLITKFHQLALARQNVAKTERKPFFVYADEFQHFVTPSMGLLLTEARKYAVGLTLAHQTLGQVRDAVHVHDALLGNAYTRIMFRVGDDDARKLAEGLSAFSARDLQSLGRGEAIVRLGSSTHDFNLRTLPLADVDTDIAEVRRAAVIEQSRQAFATPLAEVAEHLQESRAAAGIEQPEMEIVVVSDETQPEAEQGAESAPGKAQQTMKMDSVRVEPQKPKRRSVPDMEPAEMGRGGRQHKYLQHLIKRLAEERGFRAGIEEEAGNGRADVVLRKGDLSVACEISVTTGSDHEVENLKKCLAAGFSSILFVCPDKRRRDAVARKMKDGNGQVPIEFLDPEEIVSALERLDVSTQPAENTVRGYKVKVSRRTISPEDVSGRRAAVAGVIARSMRRSRDR